MPVFILKCENEECGSVVETGPTCRHSTAKEMLCEKCGSKMIIQPQSSNVKVLGFNAANGYHRETINYDGSDRGW